MSSTTTFNVTAAPDKTTTYATGDKVTIAITGGAIGPDTTQDLTVNLSLSAADGSTGTATVKVPFTKAGPALAVTIAGVTDDGAHTWAVAAGGKSASTTI